jgi:hypothetical protein
MGAVAGDFIKSSLARDADGSTPRIAAPPPLVLLADIRCVDTGRTGAAVGIDKKRLDEDASTGVGCCCCFWVIGVPGAAAAEAAVAAGFCCTIPPPLESPRRRAASKLEA